MQNLNSEIEKLPCSKIFEFYNYNQLSRSDQFNTYGNGKFNFFIFINRNEQQEIYFSEQLSTFSKAQTISFLSEAKSINEIADQVKLIGAITATSLNSNLSLATDPSLFLKLTLSLNNIPEDPGEWYSLPLFKKRIYLSSTGLFKIPLCEYRGKEATRYINYVEWEGQECRFLNDSLLGIITTIPQPGTTNLFICCHPLAWQLFSLQSKSLEHLFMLVHPRSTASIFAQSQFFLEELHLKETTLAYFKNEDLIRFNFNFTAFKISSTYSKIPVCILDYNNRFLYLKIVVVNTFVKKAWQFLNKINFQVEDNFNNGSSNYTLTDKDLYQLIKISRLDQEELTTFEGTWNLEDNCLDKLQLLINCFELQINIIEIDPG